MVRSVQSYPRHRAPRQVGLNRKITIECQLQFHLLAKYFSEDALRSVQVSAWYLNLVLSCRLPVRRSPQLHRADHQDRQHGFGLGFWGANEQQGAENNCSDHTSYISPCRRREDFLAMAIPSEQYEAQTDCASNIHRMQGLNVCGAVPSGSFPTWPIQERTGRRFFLGCRP